MKTKRRMSGGLVVALIVATLSTLAVDRVHAGASGTVTTLVGGLGQGQATNLAITPVGLAWSGGRLLIADAIDSIRAAPPLDVPYPGVVRALDTTTGTATVLAGIGAGGFSGDGGSATKARLNDPRGLAVDGNGNVYLADFRNYRIRRVSGTGVITTAAGNGTPRFAGDTGPAVAASLSAPQWVAAAPDGSVVFVDAEARVRRVDPAGNISTLVGGEAPPSLRPYPDPAPTLAFAQPTGLAVDALGNVFFYDTWSRAVVRLSPDRVLSVVSRDVVEPVTAIAIEPSGGVLVASGHALRRVDPATGKASVVAGLAYSNGGFSGDGGPAAAAQFDRLRDVAVDDVGGIYLADAGNYRVRRISQDGIVTTVAGNGLRAHGGDGGPAASAQVSGVAGMTTGPTGIYLSEQWTGDYPQGRVEAVAPDGTLRMVGTSAPNGMAVDQAGNLYLSEGAQVVKQSPTGVRSIVAGTGEHGFSGDGGPAIQAQLWNPSALAFDGQGSLYIGENGGGSGRVRRIDSGGRISTFAGKEPGSPLSDDDHNAGLATGVRLGGIADLDFDAQGSLLIIAGGTVWRVRCGVAGWLPAIRDVRQLAVDAAGALYYTTGTGLGRVDPSGAVTMIAGSGSEYPYEGRPATVAKLGYPSGVAIDAAGDVLLATLDRVVRIEKVAAPRAAPGVPCGTVPDRPAQAWGWNVLGQLGDGSFVDRPAPRFWDAPITGAVAVAGGGYHSLTLKADGTVWAWGWNGYGQLGVGSTVLHDRPVQVPGLSGVTAIAAGAFTSMALKSDGSVWAWGWNAFGQVGDGSTVDRWRPVRVAVSQKVKSISANVVHSMAVTADGTAWAWGWNGFGQLGDATLAERHVPVRVIGLFGVASVAAGYYHSLAVKGDGTVWAWGWNAQGQLGDGTAIDRRLPVQAVGLQGVSAIAAGNNHSVALAGGKVWTWGWNAQNQLGTGVPGDARVPVKTWLINASAVAAGGYHTVALTSTGLYAWGWNHFGQLGVGAASETSFIPISVRALTRPVAIASGSYHTMAVYQLGP